MTAHWKYMRTAILAAAAGVTLWQPVQAFLMPATIPEDAGEQEAEASPGPTPESLSEPAGPFDSYDRANPDFKLLQRPENVLRGFPMDETGAVDWVNALRDKVINPREVLDGSKNYLPLDLDVIMRNTKAMPFVRFPHKTHTEWLACSNCHPAIFAEKAGSTKIRMEDIFRGKFCGTCHDRVAFITHRSCFRCHSVPQSAAATSP